jgi:hypothetical protein
MKNRTRFPAAERRPASRIPVADGVRRIRRIGSIRRDLTDDLAPGSIPDQT